MTMKAIFLSNRKEELQRVYAPELLTRLAEKTDSPVAFRDKAEVLENPDAFSGVRYIFSTWGMPEFSEEEVEKYFPNLECIFYSAGTVQKFARPFLRRGVKIFSAWMANAIPVAEYTLAQILLGTKGYFLSAELMSHGHPKPAKALAKRYPGNFDTTVGIIGVGAIGKLVCQMLKPYRLRVLAYSRSLTEEKTAELGVEKSDIETIFKTCQVVSNHLANNANTQGIFCRQHFETMVPYGVFLNTGRGAQVVEEDLAEVLRERPDLTAVLDVTMPEPPLEGSPFYELPNCVLTPHIAGSMGREVHRMAEWMEEEFDAYVSGGTCRYEVTEDMLEGMA